jgi:hypothetical protein
VIDDWPGSIEGRAEGLDRALQITADWPDGTLIVRGDSVNALTLNNQLELNSHPAFRPRLRGWSVQAASGAVLYWLCQPLVQRTIRTCTLGDIRAHGGWLAKTPGGHEHCTVGGIDASTFHDLLSAPTRNPYGPKR